MKPLNDTKAVPLASDDAATVYGEEAVKLVKDTYRRLQDRLIADQSMARLPKGHLVEVLPEWTWAPPLMNAEEYRTFCTLSKRYASEGALQAIWYILENECKELRLLPAITLEREHGQVVVILH